MPSIYTSSQNNMDLLDDNNRSIDSDIVAYDYLDEVRDINTSWLKEFFKYASWNFKSKKMNKKKQLMRQINRIANDINFLAGEKLRQKQEEYTKNLENVRQHLYNNWENYYTKHKINKEHFESWQRYFQNSQKYIQWKYNQEKMKIQQDKINKQKEINRLVVQIEIAGVVEKYLNSMNDLCQTDLDLSEMVDSSIKFLLSPKKRHLFPFLKDNEIVEEYKKLRKFAEKKKTISDLWRKRFNDIYGCTKGKGELSKYFFVAKKAKLDDILDSTKRRKKISSELHKELQSTNKSLKSFKQELLLATHEYKLGETKYKGSIKNIQDMCIKFVIDKVVLNNAINCVEKYKIPNLNIRGNDFRTKVVKELSTELKNLMPIIGIKDFNLKSLIDKREIFTEIKDKVNVEEWFDKKMLKGNNKGSSGGRGGLGVNPDKVDEFIEELVESEKKKLVMA